MPTPIPRFLTLTWGQYSDLSPEEKREVNREYLEWETVRAKRLHDHYLDGDYARVGSRQATEYGE